MPTDRKTLDGDSDIKEGIMKFYRGLYLEEETWRSTFDGVLLDYLY